MTRNKFKEAADEIAQDFLHRQFPENVSADDCREYVDAAVIADWLGAEAASRDEHIILGDLCAQRLTRDQARSVLVALAIGNWQKLELLQAALVEQVARDMAYESQKIVDNYDPTDEEMSRGITPNDIDDPFLQERRSFTRRHNASLRTVR
jgi:lipase chaperone LimK